MNDQETCTSYGDYIRDKDNNVVWRMNYYTKGGTRVYRLMDNENAQWGPAKIYSETSFLDGVIQENDDYYNFNT
jgi:hypothetical protein